MKTDAAQDPAPAVRENAQCSAEGGSCRHGLCPGVLISGGLLLMMVLVEVGRWIVDLLGR